MRPDEHGCADLRRSLAGHLKVVRRLTYAPARIRSPRAGAREPPRCARGLSDAVAAPGGVRFTRNAVTDEPTASPCAAAHRPSPGTFTPRHRWPEPSHRRPRRGRAGGPRLPECEFLPLARATTKQPPPSTGRHDECGVTWHTGAVRAHCTGAREMGTAATSRLIGALTYDTYARAAAPVSHGARPARRPAGTRA